MMRDEKVMAEEFANKLTTAELDRALAHQLETENELGAAIIASALMHRIKTMAVPCGPSLVCYETAYGHTVRLPFAISVF